MFRHIKRPGSDLRKKICKKNDSCEDFDNNDGQLDDLQYFKYLRFKRQRISTGDAKDVTTNVDKATLFISKKGGERQTFSSADNNLTSIQGRPLNRFCSLTSLLPSRHQQKLHEPVFAKNSDACAFVPNPNSSKNRSFWKLNRRSVSSMSNSSLLKDASGFDLQRTTSATSMPTVMSSGHGCAAFHQMLQDLELPRAELRRQCCLAEFLTGEEELLKDFHCVQRNYLEPMRNLCILDEDELHTLFYDINRFVPIHQDLVDSLKRIQVPYDSIKSKTPLFLNPTNSAVTNLSHSPSGWLIFPANGVGGILAEWAPRLMQPYVDYCSHLVLARDLLDCKRDETRLTDYLTRCLQSGFSRRLDLWSFLDAPRARMARYPLLITRVLELSAGLDSPCHTEELVSLRLALRFLNNTLSVLDYRTAETRCSMVLERIQFPAISEINTWPNGLLQSLLEQNQLLLEGPLRDNRGTKLTVFLMEDVLLLTRRVPSTSTLQQCSERRTVSVSSSDQLQLRLRQRLESRLKDSCVISSNALKAVRQPRCRLIQAPLPTSRLILQDMPDIEQSTRFLFRLWLEIAGEDPLDSVANANSELTITLQADSSHDKAQWLLHLRQVVCQELPVVAESGGGASGGFLRRWSSMASSKTNTSSGFCSNTSTSGAGRTRLKERNS